MGSPDKILAYGKAGVVGLSGEIEHASAFIHTLRFGNKFRDAVGGTSYLSFTNTRSPAGSKISIPMMHKTDSGLRPYYLTHEFTIHDAPFDDEVVIAIGGASSGRAHARTGDRYQDMKEMGIEPKLFLMTTGTTASGTYYLFNKKDQEVPIVFIHGVGLTHEIWQPQLEFFNYHSNIAYDILGHGKSSLEDEKISFDDLSKQLIELLDHLNIKKIHLVGFSIGSLIARNFATKYNDRLHTLTLLCSIYKRTEEQQKIVNQRFEQAKQELKLSKQALKRWFTDKYLENNPEIYEKISSILSANNMDNFLKVYELFVNHKNDEDFNKIKANTLVMTGEYDIGSTVKMSQELNALISKSQLKIIKDGKHLCGIECADDVNLTIKNFIGSDE